jgi:uncharacterized protein YceK
MRLTLPRLVVVFGALALLHTSGCGSVSSGTDGGDGAAGQAGAAGGHGGGMTSTGGAGSMGSAGHGGAGSTGSAGHGGAGSTGSAGHDGGAGDGSVSCSDLAGQYGGALTAARSCTVGAANQCQQAVSSSLSPCFSNCLTYVEDATTVNALKAQWVNAGCANQGPIACPAIACLQPTMGNCVATDGGGGMCSSTSGLPTN